MPGKCLIYGVTFSTCGAMYIGNNQHKFKKIIEGHFSNLLCLLINGQQSDSFATHFKHQLKYTISYTDLRKFMTFKVVEQLKPIGAMKTFTKPNCNLRMEERLTILKKLRENASRL